MTKNIVNTNTVINEFKLIYKAGKKAIDIFTDFINGISDSLDTPVSVEDLAKCYNTSIDQIILDETNKGLSYAGGKLCFLAIDNDSNHINVKLGLYFQNSDAKWIKKEAFCLIPSNKLIQNSLQEIIVNKSIEFEVTSPLTDLNQPTKKAISFDAHPVKEYPVNFKKLYLNGIALIVGSDKHVSQDELYFLSCIIKSFDLDEKSIDSYTKIAHQFDITIFEELFKALRADKKICLTFLIDCMFVTNADGGVHKNEVALINTYFDLLFLDDDLKVALASNIFKFNGEYNDEIIEVLLKFEISNKYDFSWIKTYKNIFSA